MHMPEDPAEPETYEDGTSYLFGQATTRKAANDAEEREPTSTAGIGEESNPGAAAAPASTDFSAVPESAAGSTIKVRSGTAGQPYPGQGITLTTSPQPGDVLFGRYRVERLLGRGGMGEVWLVQHEILHDQLALKLIVAGASVDEEVLQRFVREAQVMRALSRHPHAVVVHDADIDVDRHHIYLVMDVVHGCSVDKLLTPGKPMPLEWTTEVLGQLCDVLHEAHTLGIVHRDLSPSNLMLEERPDKRLHLRVLDFGIAKVLDRASGIFDSRH